jgi:hypothetical protein
MQDLLKMMQEQLEALQASRSGPVPTKVRAPGAIMGVYLSQLFAF